MEEEVQVGTPQPSQLRPLPYCYVPHCAGPKVNERTMAGRRYVRAGPQARTHMLARRTHTSCVTHVQVVGRVGEKARGVGEARGRLRSTANLPPRLAWLQQHTDGVSHRYKALYLTAVRRGAAAELGEDSRRGRSRGVWRGMGRGRRMRSAAFNGLFAEALRLLEVTPLASADVSLELFL